MAAAGRRTGLSVVDQVMVNMIGVVVLEQRLPPCLFWALHISILEHSSLHLLKFTECQNKDKNSGPANGQGR